MDTVDYHALRRPLGRDCGCRLPQPPHREKLRAGVAKLISFHAEVR